MTEWRFTIPADLFFSVQAETEEEAWDKARAMVKELPEDGFDLLGGDEYVDRAAGCDPGLRCYVNDDEEGLELETRFDAPEDSNHAS